MTLSQRKFLYNVFRLNAIGGQDDEEHVTTGDSLTDGGAPHLPAFDVLAVDPGFHSAFAQVLDETIREGRIDPGVADKYLGHLTELLGFMIRNHPSSGAGPQKTALK